MKAYRTVSACAMAVALLPFTASTVKAADPIQPSKAAAQTMKEAWGEEVEGFKLSLKPERKIYGVGEDINLDVVFKNVDRDGVDIWGRGIALTYKLEIVCPDASMAPLTPKGEEERKGAIESLGGHGGIMYLGQNHEFSLRSVNTSFAMTQIGEYQLRVSRLVPKRGFDGPSLSDPTRNATLFSNTVTIHIESEQETRARETAKRRATTQKLQGWRGQGSKEVEGLALSLKSEKRKYARNTPIGLFMTLENSGVSDDAFFALTPAYKLEVLRADGEVAPFTSEGSRTQGVVMPLLVARQRVAGPGDTKTSQHDLNYYFDMTQPGEYYLRASLAVPRRDDAKKSATVFSNVVRIRIEAPAEN